MKFQLGQTVQTHGVKDSVPVWEIVEAMNRHVVGDWGDICEDDKQVNEEALIHGDQLLSSYTSGKGIKFWIITEADRSVTTVLLPSEY